MEILNIEICLKEEVAEIFFKGTLKFINQDYTLTEEQTLSVQKLVELIEKEDQEIIDFLNSLLNKELEAYFCILSLS